VLLNGRRLETSGAQAFGNFFDLNNIPLAAIDRIEVVADGSSAVYGSDAIAGVVNIILKKDFRGVEVNTRYSAAANLDESNSSLAWGTRWDQGSLTVIGSYQARGQLLVSQRALTASNDYTQFGGLDTNINDCNPGNVYSVDGVTPLPGLGTATYAAVPAGFKGTPSVPEFAATAGTLNECTSSFGSTLIPQTHRAGVFAQADYALTPTLQLFTELMYSSVGEFKQDGFNALDGSPGSQAFMVSSSNPYNPFGTMVGVSGLFVTNP